MQRKKTKPELYAEIAELKRELGKARASAGKIFAPHHLKTIEVDTENKIFKVNGEEFGRDCTGFTIWCDGPGRFNIRMDLDARVRYVHYENNEIVSDETGVPHSGEWTDNLKKSRN